VPCNADNALYSRRYVTTCGGKTRAVPLNPGDNKNEKTTINRFPGKAEKNAEDIWKN
jgi:hypothetical protein